MSEFKSTYSLEGLPLWVWDLPAGQEGRGAFSKGCYLQLESTQKTTSFSSDLGALSSLFASVELRGLSVARWCDAAGTGVQESLNRRRQLGLGGGLVQGEKPGHQVKNVRGGCGGGGARGGNGLCDAPRGVCCAQNIRFGQPRLGKLIDVQLWKEAEYTRYNTTTRLSKSVVLFFFQIALVLAEFENPLWVNAVSVLPNGLDISANSTKTCPSR